MSPTTNSGQGPRKGQESGRTTTHEHKRTKQAGSNAKAGRQAFEPEGSGDSTGSKCAAGEALVESLSSDGSAGVDFEAAWTAKQ